MIIEKSKYSFDRLKQQITITDVLAHYRLETKLRNKGSYLLGPCPLHGGDNPSAFRVNAERGIWNCFTACKTGGDIVDLVCCIEQCGYAKAARILYDISKSPQSGPVPFNAHKNDAIEKPPFRPFRKTIPLNPNVPFLQNRKGIFAATAVEHETGCSTRSTFLKGTVAVRLHDLNGQPLGYCGRRLDPQQITTWGKWRFPTGLPKSQLLYNAHRVLEHTKRSIVVVECPFAAMRLRQAGIKDAVSLLGTALSHTQAKWLAQAESLLLMLDGDQPGRSAAKYIANILNASTKVFVHNLPDNKEPEDLTDTDLAARVNQYPYFSLNPYPTSTPRATS
jgi:DNA primase